MTSLRILFVSFVLVACSAERDAPRADTSVVSFSPGAVDTPAVVPPADTGDYPVVRGLYLNRFAPQSPRRMRRLLDMADSTELNAFVIDMKDEFGLNYVSSSPAVRKYAGDGHGVVRDVKALTDSVKAHGLLPIARIVAFKDPVAARLNTAWTIKQEDGSVWLDKEGLAWVSAHHREVWDYNLAVAEELVALGFEEIQWDYIRFPEPYPSLPRQVFAGKTLSNPDALAAFLRLARERLSRYNVRSTADVFGLVTTVRGALEIGQQWEKMSAVTDVMLPMVYPSHYPRGAFGVARPNAEPYTIVRAAIEGARARDDKLGITRAEHVRPWIQAFSIGQPPYGAEEVELQKRAIYDAGYQGWILWHPGSNYEIFLPGLDRTKPCRFVYAATDSVRATGRCS
ncbi:MAG: putative glycoside hydrolase [Gemmatimonadaceae bacterium]